MNTWKFTSNNLLLPNDTNTGSGFAQYAFGVLRVKTLQIEVAVEDILTQE